MGLPSLSVQIDVAIKATQAATQAAIAAAAVAANAKIMGTDPRPSLMVRHVDGAEGAPETAVRPDGVIVYDYSRLDTIAAAALDVLRALSPVRSGEYRDNHSLLLNGNPVDKLAGWKPGDEVTIINLVPYARIIEVGAMKMRVPGTDHVYQQAQQIMEARSGDEAKFTFTFRNMDGGRVSAKRARNGVNRWPALIITER